MSSMECVLHCLYGMEEFKLSLTVISQMLRELAEKVEREKA